MTDIFSESAFNPKQHNPAPSPVRKQPELSIEMFKLERQRTGKRDGTAGSPGAVPKNYENHGSNAGAGRPTPPHVVERRKKVARLLKKGITNSAEISRRLGIKQKAAWSDVRLILDKGKKP